MYKQTMLSRYHPAAAKPCTICSYDVPDISTLFLCCRDRLFAEIRVLKQLKHKNIMTFYDSWLDQKTYSVNFITEMFTSGTLRQYVPISHCPPLPPTIVGVQSSSSKLFVLLLMPHASSCCLLLVSCPVLQLLQPASSLQSILHCPSLGLTQTF